jgi:hypothetical protein
MVYAAFALFARNRAGLQQFFTQCDQYRTRIMSEERTTTYETPAAERTTIIHDGPSRGSGGAVWIFGIVLLIAILAVVYFMSTQTDSEVVRDNAIAGAAEQVGDAAQQAGNAAENAADNMAR